MSQNATQTHSSSPSGPRQRRCASTKPVGPLVISDLSPEFTERIAVPGTGAKDTAVNKTSTVRVFKDVMSWVGSGGEMDTNSTNIPKLWQVL